MYKNVEAYGMMVKFKKTVGFIQQFRVQTSGFNPCGH